MNDKAEKDCIAKIGIQDCENADHLEFYRQRVVLFRVDTRLVAMSPGDQEFATATPINAGQLKKREELLREERGDGSPAATPR